MYEEDSKERIAIETAAQLQIEEEKKNITVESLKDRLDTVRNIEKENQNQQIETVKSFMQQQAELETDDLAKRIEFLEAQKVLLMGMYEDNSQERIAIEQAANEAIKESIKDLADYEKEKLKERIEAATQFFGGMSSLLDAAGDKNRAALVAAKTFAMIEAGINTALAATKALSSAPPPFNYVLMAGVIAAGVAQQIKIGQSMIPSKETGGRFIVPQGKGVDDKLYRFNGGEEVNVTPRGQTGQQETFNFKFVMNSNVFAEIINQSAKAGELYTLQLSRNI
jgi:hypothetical protein